LKEENFFLREKTEAKRF